jgi:uncharacterized protein YciI
MGHVIVAHVAIDTSPDYVERREPHRRVHIERLARLRAAGTLVAGGPAPDGRSVDLFYRVAEPREVDGLITEDPYHRAGAWTGHRSRHFAEFVDPWEAEPPIVLDGSRRVTLVEGPAADPELARFALIELRGQGRLVLGGTLAIGGGTGESAGQLDGSGGVGHILALLGAPEPAEALAWLGETGLFSLAALRARPLLYVL